MPEEATTSSRDRTHSNAMETSPSNPTSPPIIIGPELTAPPPLEDEKMRKYFLSRLPLQRRRTAPDGKEEWDEVCFLWLKQTNEGRKLNLDPRTQLVCFAKKESTNGEVSRHCFDNLGKETGLLNEDIRTLLMCIWWSPTTSKKRISISEVSGFAISQHKNVRFSPSSRRYDPRDESN